MAQPRVLFYDIETSHNIVAVFRLFGEDYISHENLLQERYIICAAWRWEGETKVHGVSVLDDAKRFKKNSHDDFHVVQTLHNVMAQANILVGHNADRYDRRFYETRALVNGIAPLPPIASVDTLKVAKARFLFNNNRLDYLGQLLGLGRKKATPRGLWLDVLKGDAKAIKTMLAYNKQDVVLLEAVYRKLAPYVKLATSHSPTGCPRCGSLKTILQGTRRTVAAVYPRHQCTACGGWFQGAKALSRTAETRVL